MKHHCHLLVVQFNCDIPYYCLVVIFVLQRECDWNSLCVCRGNIWLLGIEIHQFQFVSQSQCATELRLQPSTTKAGKTNSDDHIDNSSEVWFFFPVYSFSWLWMDRFLCTIKKAIPSNLDDPSASNEATKRTILFYSMPKLELDASFSSLWCTEVREVWDQGETETQCVLMGTWGEFEL